MPNGDDHDLLIEIHTKLSMIHDNFINHLKEDASHFSELRRDMKAAHRRLDYFTVSGILVVLVFVVTVVIGFFRIKGGA